MSLSPVTLESLSSTHTRIKGGEAFFYIPRQLAEIPQKTLERQLSVIGESLTDPKIFIKPPSTPKELQTIPPEKLKGIATQIARVLRIPEAFRTTQIPEAVDTKITLQSEASAAQNQPITIDIGPIPSLTRTDHANSLLYQLWFDHIGRYANIVTSSNNEADIQYVADSTDYWVYEPCSTAPHPTQDLHIPLTEKQIVSTEELRSLEQSLLSTWVEMQPILNDLMKKCKFADWNQASKNIREFHKEMRFDYVQHRAGPVMMEHGSEILKFEEQMSQLLAPLKELGLTQLTPKTILDMCSLVTQNVDPHLLTSQDQYPIPFTNTVIPKPIFDIAMRRLAQELAYNKYYTRTNTPIRVMNADSTILEGLRRIGMSTTPKGLPKVGSELNQAMMFVHSRDNDETRIITLTSTSALPPITTITLELAGARYDIPFHITDLSFKKLLTQ